MYPGLITVHAFVQRQNSGILILSSDALAPLVLSTEPSVRFLFFLPLLVQLWTSSLCLFSITRSCPSRARLRFHVSAQNCTCFCSRAQLGIRSELSGEHGDQRCAAFNRSALVQQVWHVRKAPDSLCTHTHRLCVADRRAEAFWKDQVDNVCALTLICPCIELPCLGFSNIWKPRKIN